MTTAEQGGVQQLRGWLPTAVKRGAFLFLTLLTLATLYVHEAYVFKPADPEWARLAQFRWWLVPHIVAGAVAFVVAPLQFSATLRRRSLTLHRWLGRLYVCAVIVASSLSLYIVLVFEDPANRWVMGTMGGLWLVTTIFAWLAARNRNLIQHRLWIGRSYCLTFTFVTTRFIPDMVLPGLGYVGTTALYWVIIVLSLVIPDLLVNGGALLPWRRRPAP
jgi:hypothetical protein